MLNFRDKKWKRDCNHYNLVGTPYSIYQWNSGAKANFMIEVIGERAIETITVHGKGEAARDSAIRTVYKLAGIAE